MKKLLLLFVILLVFTPLVRAEDVDLPASGDLWENWEGAQSAREVKPVTDEDFDKAVEQIESKKNKRANRLKKKQIPKGEEFHNANETEIIREHTDNNTLPVLSIPVELRVGENILPVGHYQVNGEEKEGNFYINFYQAQYLMAKIPAIETEDDFDEETITFARWFEAEGKRIKVIFGSMSFNIYALVDIAE